MLTSGLLPCGHAPYEHAEGCPLQGRDDFLDRFQGPTPFLFCHQCYPDAVSSLRFTTDELARPLAPSSDVCVHCGSLFRAEGEIEGDFGSSDGGCDTMEEYVETLQAYDDVLNGGVDRERAPPREEGSADRGMEDRPSRPMLVEFIQSTFGNHVALQERYLPHVYALLRHGEVRWPIQRLEHLAAAPDPTTPTGELLEIFVTQSLAATIFQKELGMGSGLGPDAFWLRAILPSHRIFGSRPSMVGAARYVEHFTYPRREMLDRFDYWTAVHMFQGSPGAPSPCELSDDAAVSWHEWEGRVEAIWALPEEDLRALLIRELTAIAAAWAGFMGREGGRRMTDDILRWVTVQSMIVLTWCEGSFGSHRTPHPSVVRTFRAYLRKHLVWHPSASAPLFELATQAVVDVCHSSRLTERLAAGLSELVENGPTAPAYVELGPSEEVEVADPAIYALVRTLARRAGMYVLAKPLEDRLVRYFVDGLDMRKLTVRAVYDSGEVIYNYIEGRIFPQANARPRNYCFWGHEDGWEDSEDAEWRPEDEIDVTADEIREEIERLYDLSDDIDGTESEDDPAELLDAM